MKGKRLKETLRMWSIRSSIKRVNYLKKHHIFGAIGENCTIMDRTIPLYANLIKLGNNVKIASNVRFVTHDITFRMLNLHPGFSEKGDLFSEKLGCIEVGDNVFIGTGSTILYNVRIGSNVIIGSCSLVNKDIPDNCVAAGIPARVIGTFDEFVQKRMSEGRYPAELTPKQEVVSDTLADLHWNQIEIQRK